jgi:hypothetical protein
MNALLDPTNNYVFKRLFAEAPELLVALINDLHADSTESCHRFRWEGCHLIHAGENWGRVLFIGRAENVVRPYFLCSGWWQTVDGQVHRWTATRVRHTRAAP